MFEKGYDGESLFRLFGVDLGLRLGVKCGDSGEKLGCMCREFCLFVLAAIGEGGFSEGYVLFVSMVGWQGFTF